MKHIANRKTLACLSCDKKLDGNRAISVTVVSKPSIPLADIRLFCSNSCRIKNARNTLTNDVIDENGLEIGVHPEIYLAELLKEIREDFYKNVKRNSVGKAETT